MSKPVPEYKYQPPLATWHPPVEGVEYYRSDAFGGLARGDLFMAYYKKTEPSGIL